MFLVPQHSGKAGAPHASIRVAVDPQDGLVQSQRQQQVLDIKAIVWKGLRWIIGKTARESRRHSGRCQAISFEAELRCVRRGGVEVQAEEEAGLLLVGKRNAVRERKVVVVCA